MPGTACSPSLYLPDAELWVCFPLPALFHIPGPETSHKGGSFLEGETKGQENGVQDRQGWGEEKSEVKVHLGEEGQRKGERTNKKQRT